MNDFDQTLEQLKKRHEKLLKRKNKKVSKDYNGIYLRYKYPVLTAEHIPLTWRFDLNRETNPLLLQRIGVNAVFNAGAIFHKNKYKLVARVEGWDRKSYFAVAESDSGIDDFRFQDRPVTLPETTDPDTNVYDMRLTEHEDGWIYGVFATERKDPRAPEGDTWSAVAGIGIARTRDMIKWERLDDLKTSAPQQRDVVLHPEFVNGKYAFYTRPQEGFIEAGKKSGLGYGFSDSIEHAVIEHEKIMDQRVYHSVYELKNGQGPPPLKTEKGWLHLAHGVRNTAAGLRYTLYLFLTDLHDPFRIIRKPAGYFMAPRGKERVGDVSNVLFSNGWIARENGEVFIYYASSDTRMHVATTSIERLLDYVFNTPEDGWRSAASVQQIKRLIDKNINIP